MRKATKVAVATAVVVGAFILGHNTNVYHGQNVGVTVGPVGLEIIGSPGFFSTGG